jgi:hypothetical protein
MNKRLMAAVVAALLLSACASTPPRMLSAPPGDGYVVARTARLDVTDHMTRHLNDGKDILYKQSSGGGGAAVGILLGPLGVMANAKMIESKTDADVALLKNKITVVPRTLFADAMQKNGQVLGASPQANRVSPYLYITKSEERLYVLSAVIVESDAPSKFSATYQYQLPTSYTVAEMAALDSAGMQALNDAAANGFDQLVKRLEAEKQTRPDTEQKIAFHSKVMQPLVDMEMQGALVGTEGDIVWVRTYSSLVGLRKANLSYKPAL